MVLMMVPAQREQLPPASLKAEQDRTTAGDGALPGIPPVARVTRNKDEAAIK